MYAIRCGVHSRSSPSGSPTPSWCTVSSLPSMAADPRRDVLTRVSGMDPAALWPRGWHDAHAGHVPDGLTAARTLPAFGERSAAAVGVTTVAVVDGEVAGFVMVVGDEVE